MSSNVLTKAREKFKTIKKESGGCDSGAGEDASSPSAKRLCTQYDKMMKRLHGDTSFAKDCVCVAS